MSIEVRNITPWDEVWWERKLNTNFLSALKLDSSSYAKGRRRIWLDRQPSLSSYDKLDACVSTTQSSRLRDYLKELIKWDFDYCLLTNSGPEGHGITLHRDAGSLSYEGYGINLTGTCDFNYLEQRRGFGPGPTSEEVHHTVQMWPGTVVHFNTKNPHSAIPSPNRWAVNLWKAK